MGRGERGKAWNELGFCQLKLSDIQGSFLLLFNITSMRSSNAQDFRDVNMTVMHSLLGRNSFMGKHPVDLWDRDTVTHTVRDYILLYITS